MDRHHSRAMGCAFKDKLTFWVRKRDIKRAALRSRGTAGGACCPARSWSDCLIEACRRVFLAVLILADLRLDDVLLIVVALVAGIHAELDGRFGILLGGRHTLLVHQVKLRTSGCFEIITCLADNCMVMSRYLFW